MAIQILLPLLQFLGINIDSNLTWKAHINYIAAKISNTAGVLLRLSKDLSYNVLILIYNTIILLYLTYCCIIWEFTYQTYINKIFTIKKGNTHKYSFSISLFKKTNNLNIFQLIEYYASISMPQKINNSL